MSDPTIRDDLDRALTPVYEAEEVRTPISRWLAKQDATTREDIALALVGAVGARTNGEGDGSRVMTRTVASIEAVDVDWFWHERIPYGMLSEVTGDPGEGKSHLTLALATAETLGVPLPGEPSDRPRKPGHVLLLCVEDSPEATVRPRLESMGADLDRVTIFDGIRGEDGHVVPLDLSRPDHRAELRHLVSELAVTLVVIDPVTAHLGGANEWKDSEVRSVLAPLAQLAGDTGAAVLLVRHLRKSDSTRAIYRAGGSIAFTASVRSSLMVGRPESDGVQRAVVRVKGNLSPEPPAVGFTLDEHGFAWTEGGDWTASDLLQGDETREERSKRDEAHDWLRDRLAEGPVAVKDLKRSAEADGIGWRTLERVKKAIGVEARREGGIGDAGRWSWTLPPKPATPSNPAREEAPGGLSETPHPARVPEGSGDLTPPASPYIGGVADLEPEARCHDCGREVEPDPAFTIQRCNSCALRAGKEERSRG